jgi:enoyl-CoA hydratase
MLVLTEKRDLIATITLNRPEKLNALSRELVAELVEAFEALREDEAVRAVVLTGAGRAFSAGADLGGQRGEHGRTIEEWEARMAENQARQFMVRDFPKPVIAAVHGYALGRGCELALWCDVVIASEEAKFGEPEIRHGSMVASMIPYLANPQQAKLLILTGDTITAREALEMGLVARVVPPDRLLPEAQGIALRMAKVPPFAVRYNKQLINAMYDAMGFRSAMDYGHKIETLCHSRIPEAENVEGVNLERLRREAGVKAFLDARDRPFRER